MLTDSAIKAAIRGARAEGKASKHYDQDGLFLLATATGSGLFRFKYKIGGGEKLLSLGKYPDVPLKLARQRRDDARKLVAAGTDPSEERKAEKAALSDTVKVVSMEWLERQTGNIADSTVAAHTQRLQDYIFPTLGNKSIRTIEPPELLAALRKIESKGLHDTAHRTLSLCGRIWRYAISTSRASRDISRDLADALTPHESENFAAVVDPKAVGELMRALHDYRGQATVCYALKLAPLLFVRPGELRHAEWSEFDLDSSEPTWRIPAEKMKMKDAHIVPLSHQAVDLLRELATLSSGKYLFASLSDETRPMSENTVNSALRRMGYTGDMQTGHGFRTIASTTLNELGWHSDLIELQLAHRERNKSRAAYNKALRLAERRKMMQAWSDHLDALRTSEDKKIVSIRRSA